MYALVKVLHFVHLCVVRKPEYVWRLRSHNFTN